MRSDSIARRMASVPEISRVREAEEGVAVPCPDAGTGSENKISHFIRKVSLPPSA